MTCIPPARVGLALGLWGFVLGLLGFKLSPRGFLDPNMLVCPTRNGHVGGLNQCDGPTRVVSHCSGI